MQRFYRLSLTSLGYQDETVEFLHYGAHQKVKVRFLRDDLIEEVPLCLLFPVSIEAHHALVEHSPSPTLSAQLDLFGS
jgi:hypothetical protein